MEILKFIPVFALLAMCGCSNIMLFSPQYSGLNYLEPNDTMMTSKEIRFFWLDTNDICCLEKNMRNKGIVCYLENQQDNDYFRFFMRSNEYCNMMSIETRAPAGKIIVTYLSGPAFTVQLFFSTPSNTMDILGPITLTRENPQVVYQHNITNAIPILGTYTEYPLGIRIYGSESSTPSAYAVIHCASNFVVNP